MTPALGGRIRADGGVRVVAVAAATLGAPAAMGRAAVVRR